MISTPIDLILEAAKAISSVVPRTDWYLFGSFLKNPVAAPDIDLLVVCQDHLAGTRIREYLSANILVEWPIHLLIMTTQEEIEANFIVGQCCRSIFKTPP